MGWLDKSVSENKGIEMIGGKRERIVHVVYDETPLKIRGDRNLFGVPCPNHIDRETGLPKKGLKKIWEELTKIHEPLKMVTLDKDKDGNLIGQMIIMGAGGEIEEQDSFEELFNKSDSYNFIHFKRQWKEDHL